MTKTINLRDFYYWYTQDEFIEVSDEVAAELLADKRYERAYKRRAHYNKVYSLDAGDSMETAAITYFNDSPEHICEKMEQHCDLCQALNSLPDIQGSRIEAHYLLGMSQKEIAEAEGVSESAVNAAIRKGLAAMKRYLKNFTKGGCFLVSESHDI